MNRLTTTALAALLVPLALGTAQAAEYPAGDPVMINGMEVAAVYLQPIEMEPAGMMKPAAETDIHLEADIHATKDNTNGFAEGDWIPDLAITYDLVSEDGSFKSSGSFMPMVASDGPHYGDNIKLGGEGKYKLTFHISPPGTGTHFGRHVDKETGVAAWFAPFDASYEFVYAGTGKKGSY
ncbi:MAG: iron transporter [Hyphomicrobiales bacterium]|uniref:iron transporter n=1 Tax=Aestuariivirga sp. TaxID=2650926 RepID=UPI0035B39075